MSDTPTPTPTPAPGRAGQTLCKEERLTRKKIIDDAWKHGKSFKTPALIMLVHPTALPVDFPAQVMFSVSKRNFRRAHDRNRVKRLLREAYRKQKELVYKPLREAGRQAAVVFIFTGRQLPNYPYVHGKIMELLRRFPADALAPEKNHE